MTTDDDRCTIPYMKQSLLKTKPQLVHEIEEFVWECQTVRMLAMANGARTTILAEREVHEARADTLTLVIKALREIVA